jgi:hypothetical protein
VKKVVCLRVGSPSAIVNAVMRPLRLIVYGFLLAPMRDW